MPEEAAIDLGADDSLRSLQDVARVALEHHMIARLSAVPAAGPVGGHAGVIAGGGCRDCGRKNDESLNLSLMVTEGFLIAIGHFTVVRKEPLVGDRSHFFLKKIYIIQLYQQRDV